MDDRVSSSMSGGRADLTAADVTDAATSRPQHPAVRGWVTERSTACVLSWSHVVGIQMCLQRTRRRRQRSGQKIKCHEEKSVPALAAHCVYPRLEALCQKRSAPSAVAPLRSLVLLNYASFVHQSLFVNI